MFVRIKKIKGYQYAYLVENSWQGGSSRQKVKGYLGRVYSLDVEHKPFSGTLSGSFKEIVRALVQWQLECYGFAITQQHAIKDGLRVDLCTFSFVQEKTGKVFVLKGKEGYLCQHTITELLSFTSEGYEEKVGRDLAHAFVAAGISVPKETFITIFEKVYKEPE